MKPKVGTQVVRTSLAARLGVAIALVGITSALWGCDGDRRPPHLDVAAASDQPDDTDEWVNQQHLLRLKWIDPQGVVTEVDNALPGDIVFPLYGSCAPLITSPAGSCARDLEANVQWHICVAKGALAVATPQSDPIKLVTAAPMPVGHVVIDRVTEANAARIAGFAAEYARYAISIANSRLSAPPTSCRSSGASGTWQLINGKPASLAFAGAMVEAYYLARAAMDRAVEATVNVSDEARSSTSSPEVSEERSILAAHYSRAAAAHMLVGGSDGLLGSTTSGYCLKQDLSPKASMALRLLRDAAPPPSLLANNDISVLLNSNQTEGSVRQRLGKFYSIPVLQGPTGMQTVEQYYDLTSQDFVKARTYLRQEVSVFGRSATAKSLAQVPDGTGYYQYAGTSGDRVRELPPGAWSARARYLTTTPSPWYNSSTGVFHIAPNGESPVYSDSLRFAPVETLITATHAAARDLLQSTDHFSNVVATPYSNEVFGLVSSILTSKEYQGVVEFSPSSGSGFRGYAHGYTAADKVRAVVGEDGLRCAVLGSIEGVDCDDALTGAQYNDPLPAGCTGRPATLSCLTIQTLAGDTTAATNLYYGFNHYTGGVTRTVATANLVTAKTPIYMVKLKAGLTLEKPGNFELLGGSAMKTNYYVSIPVVPSLDEKVAKVLAPNRKNCGVPSVNCMGKEFDARLPLEDSLTGDGDDVESSWRHYLDLAKQAAAESDSLGREFRDAKLNKMQGAALAAQRKEDQLQAAEAAIEEVQTLCGTALDNRKLVDYLSGGPDSGANLDTLALTTAACPATACPADAVCISGKCVKDLAKLTQTAGFQNEPDAQRLADCLSTGPTAVEKFVSLGDKELCVYSTPGHPNAVCPSTVGTNPCPHVKGTAACSLPSHDANVAKPLSYFVNKDPGVENSQVNPCQAFRQARKLRTNSLQLAGLLSPVEMVKNHEVFLPGRFSHTVGTLGFVAKIGGFFDITENGTKRWSSGNISLDPNRTTTEWPHLSPAAGCNLAAEEGLFCTSFPASNDTQIAAMHKRVIEAVFAATAIRRSMDPSKYAMEIHFPSDGGWTVKQPNTTSVFRMPGSTPILETKWAANSRGQRTSYGTSPVPLWIKPDGTTIATTAPNMGIWGPADPNTGVSNAEFTANLIPTFCTGTCFEWVLSVLRGEKAEDEGHGVAMGHRDAALLQYMITRVPEYLDPLTFETRYPETTFSSRSILDGYEMLCELDRLHSDVGNQPVSLALNPQDLSRSAASLRRFADDIERRGALTLFANVPAAAAAALGSSAPDGGFPDLGGEMSAAVSDLKASFIEVQTAMPTIASQLIQMGNAADTLSAQLSTVEANKDLSDLTALSTALNQAAACADAMTHTARNMMAFGSHVAITCINSIAQTAIGFRRASLEQTIQDNEAAIANAQFRNAMAQHAEVMQQAALGLETAYERSRAAINRIESIRKQASLALAKAVYLASYQSAEQVAYDKAVGSLSSLAQRRYIQALKNAKLMSFFARRAIEQRLGVDLTEMRDDLPLVEAPENWEGEVCTMNGVMPDPDSYADQAMDPSNWVAVYGKGFVGDYVSKLERVVESYRLEHNFQEGRDVAIVSLRDDVLNVRTDCPTPSRNLLKHDLGNAEGWTARNCNSVTVGGVPQPAHNCIQAVPSPEYAVAPSTIKKPDVAVKGQLISSSGANGYILRFGVGTATCPAATCGWKNGSALSQITNLEAGKYRLSWYTRDAGYCGVAGDCNPTPAGVYTCTTNLCTANYTNGAKAGIVVVRGHTNAAGVTTPNPAAPTNFVAPQEDSQGGDRCSTSNNPASACLSRGWRRASIEFTITVPGDYEVGFGVAQGTVPTPAQEVTIGAPMLETLPANGVLTHPSAYQLTDSDGNTTIKNCEDTDGSRFRRQHWTRKCVHLCDNGFSDNCSKGPEYCYQELTFGVSQPWIAAGKMFNYSGFARGNYNYRIDSLALNFVGSHTRDCTDASLPSTCYNAGFIPYSIQHNGPFFTRNHEGADVEAMLFDGRIEHARGLALERYVTNPIASTDRELLSDYMRKELAGRPLDGSFVVRMWEEPGVNLEAVEDIQLVLNYRYWTAFD